MMTLNPVGDPEANKGPGMPDDDPTGIKIDWNLVYVTLVWLVFGITVMILWWNYDNRDKFAPTCTVMEGRLLYWLGNRHNTLVAYSMFGLLVSGLFQKFLLMAQLTDEAYCCSDLCQGMCGNVLRAFLFVLLVSVNFFGTFLVAKSMQIGVQGEYPILKETFCKTWMFRFVGGHQCAGVVCHCGHTANGHLLVLPLYEI